MGVRVPEEARGQWIPWSWAGCCELLDKGAEN